MPLTLSPTESGTAISLKIFTEEACEGHRSQHIIIGQPTKHSELFACIPLASPGVPWLMQLQRPFHQIFSA